MVPAPPGSARALVSALCAWLDRLFPDAERLGRLMGELEGRFGDDDRAVNSDLCREIEAVAHEFSRHFALEYVQDGTLVPDTEPPGWPPQDPRDVELRGGSVREVERRPDGVGVLALDGLDAVQMAAPFLKAAFDLLRGSRGVVLDLRCNGGGDPGSMTLTLEWLLGAEPTHISDVIYRNRTRQWWTTGRLGDLALRPDTPVVVLISERTSLQEKRSPTTCKVAAEGGWPAGARRARPTTSRLSASPVTCARSCPKPASATP